MKKVSQKWVALLMAGSMFLFCSVNALALNKGKVLYTYNAATAASEWQRYARGEWHYDADGISCVNNDGRTGDDAWYYTYIGNKNGWKNYVVECDLNNVSEGGIIFRSTNPTDATVDAFDGYYCGTDSDFIFFGKDEKDKWKTIQTDGPDASQCYKIGYKAAMHWELHVVDNTFTLYLDGDKFPTAQIVDKDNSYPSGGIAIRYRVYSGDDSGKIANLKVTELTDQVSGGTQTGTAAEQKAETNVSETENTENTATASGNESTIQKAEESNGTAANTVTDTVTETVDGKFEIPVVLWILFGIIAAAFVAVPVILVLYLRKSKR